MALKIDSPNLSGRSIEENIEYLQTWAVKLSNELNFALSHLDKTNFVEGQEYITQEELIKKMDEQYLTLREYVIKRTGG